GLLRWLVSSADLLPGQKLALRGEKVRFAPSEPAAVTLLLREEAAKGAVPAVELRGDGISGVRAVRPVALGDEPGTYRAVFGPLAAGPRGGGAGGAGAAGVGVGPVGGAGRGAGAVGGGLGLAAVGGADLIRVGPASRAGRGDTAPCTVGASRRGKLGPARLAG